MNNREIRFRGKRIDNGEWIVGDLVHQHWIRDNVFIPVSIRHLIKGIYSFPVAVIPESVGQFTGLYALKRKGNLEKEVFELDVFREQKETNIRDEVQYLIVMWIKQRAAFYLIPASHYHVIGNSDVSKEKEFEWLFSDAALYDFAIDIGLTKVGNIIDNPELLNQ